MGGGADRLLNHRRIYFLVKFLPNLDSPITNHAFEKVLVTEVSHLGAQHAPHALRLPPSSTHRRLWDAITSHGDANR